MEIKGKNAIVTGGRRGIGRAIALELAKRGANVGINYVTNETKARETLSEIEKFGVKGILLKGDVSKIGDVKNFVKKFVDEFKRIDILINNAGILSKNINFLDVSEEEWDRIIDVNLKGTFLVTKEALPFMPDGGKIINMSSIAGKMGGTVGAHYAASKAGVIGLTFALASELAKRKITVNAIAPGPVDTELITEEIKERLSKVTPLGRIATPEEIAKTALFLIENDFVDGEVIDVNGARYMD
ncbi:MAG TPA: 3-oxoacyl-ACP reductase FabG [Candidatus Atribacteria bacterium]|nr:3-oxoacyl-ACP reductase FabG [Candidatus Atribacteria bacterium]